VAGIAGQPFRFVVTATLSPKTYSATGLPPGLSINSSTGVITGTPTAAGTYKVAVTANGTGGLAASTLTITIGASGGAPFTPVPTSLDSRLVNLSSRVDLSGGQVLVAGFAISGAGPKSVLLRAVGPGLTEFGVPGAMPTPELRLYSSSGSIIDQNTGWGNSPTIAATIAQVGAFSLAPGSADSAIVTSLEPGAYTVQVFDPLGTGGTVLLEIYDADASPMTSPERLINISAMGAVTPTTGALFGGFVISGSSTKSILIRGIGPGLSSFGITNPLADPVLSVFDSDGNLVAQNFSWTSQAATGSDQPTIAAADITAADTSVAAFTLSSLNADTALIANLPPGAYTFEVSSASGATGVVLGEVYELP
jgi:PKD repeat protein